MDSPDEKLRVNVNELNIPDNLKVDVKNFVNKVLLKILLFYFFN